MGIHFRMRVGASAGGRRESERGGCRAAAANPSRVETDGRTEARTDGRTTELKYCATLIGFLGEHSTAQEGGQRPPR